MRRHAAVIAAVLVAAGLVAWVRLAPLGLPALPERAAALARAAVATRFEPPPADLPKAVDDWIAAHPTEWQAALTAEQARLDEAWRFRDTRGRRWPFLGDLDSYAWLRAARTTLQRGTPCDAEVNGRCRDALALAPVGLSMPHARSLHIAAIAALHRAATAVDPDFPLPASAFLVPVLVGVLGVLPAFAIGRRLGGVIGGFIAALVASLQPTFLARSIGSDNDVWNVVLPLYAAWALVAAAQARRRRDQCLAALLAAAVIGVHAVSWSGWGFGFFVLLGGLGAALALHAAHWARRRGSARVWDAPTVRTLALAMAVFAAATALATHLGGAQEPLGGAFDRIVAALRPTAAPPPPGDARPSALRMVGELGTPTLGGIAGQSYGNLLFFAGWLGMLLLLLPRRDWRVPHYLVLIAGTLLYRLLLTAALPRGALVGLLALPLLAAAVIEARDGDEADVDAAGVGMLIAVWLLAALYVSFSAARFIMLLAAPLGIATGVAAGRLYGWLAAELREWIPGARSADALAAIAVLALAILPVRGGYATAAARLPMVDAAWAATLERLRDTTPPETIVTTWWDYGYWAKYFAERRTTADGGTLLTAVPYWLARLQTTADEAEAIGLLRMLDCGSDARPYPEGAAGAVARLTRHGLDERRAEEAVAALASRDRAAAAEHLAGLGLEPAARDEVLAATHCAPPPAVLVLSSEQVPLTPWWRLGAWRPGGVDPATRPAGLYVRDWVPCALEVDRRRCALRTHDGRGGRVLAVEFPDGRPQEARLVVERDGVTSSTAPSRLLVAGAMDIEATEGSDPSAPALLLDGQQRVLIGAPDAVASLFVRLMFLDGRGLRHFRKLDERTGARRQRVAAWAVEW